jgi:hypothetical protein
MAQFLCGVLAMGFFLAGAFFAKFWWRTRDGLFACFAAAFALLAVEQVLLAAERLPREEESWVYLLRLAAFLFIIAAVAVKNRARWR